MKFPDILHSYLGLAALSIMKEPGLKSLDSTLCISVAAFEHLEQAIGKLREEERRRRKSEGTMNGDVE